MPEPQVQIDAATDLLGRISELGSPLWRWLGNMETRMLRSRLPQRIESPIYICGLARAGTTILLEFLSENQELSFHRYRDFPFLFTPVMWGWFQARAQKKGTEEAMERAHKDGIMVTADSPEAMEECLWMRFFPSCHDPRTSDVLTSEGENPSFERFYRDHIRKMLFLRGGSRYLAKGNYNLSRIQYLHRLFPDARFVIPYRDPVTHIASLMKQHALFSREERRDKRILDYMRRAGHFEFGLNRVPVNFGNTEEALEVQDLWSRGEEVKGWARYWASAYRFVARTLKEDSSLSGNTVLVHYEQLCRSPYDTLNLLYAHCKVSPDGTLVSRQAQRIAPPTYYVPSFSDEEVETIHEETDAVLQELLSLNNL